MKAKGKRATARQEDIAEAIAAINLETPGGANAVQIAKRLGITRSGLRAQLRALEKKGLALDEPRVVRSGKWKLTRAGKALVKAPEPEPAEVDE